jgi:hypothetical protein
VYLRAESGVAWTQSRVDNWVYWRSKQIRLAGVQGWWWDHGIYGPMNDDPVVGPAYMLPPHKFHKAGRLQPGFNYFLPRQFFKRISRIITREPDLTITSCHYGGIDSLINAPFQRDEINWEGAAGYCGGFPHMYTFGLGFTRFCANGYTGLCGLIRDLINKVGGGDPVLDRSDIAQALLHDLGTDRARIANKSIYGKTKAALEAFGFFDPQDAVTFIPYWRSRHLYRFGPEYRSETAGGGKDPFAAQEETARKEELEHIVCSAYRHRKTGEALLIVANNSDKALEDYLYISDDLLGRRPTTCLDVEMQQEIEPTVQRHGARKLAVPNTFGPMFVDRYQHRMLLVE